MQLTPDKSVSGNWLLPLSGVYGAGVRLRNLAFDRGWLRSDSVPARVVSIGNLSVGGSGKSELAVQLLQLHQRGEAALGLLAGAGKIGVVSRGYRRRSRGCLVVSDGTRPLLSAWEGGDEPLMIARRCPGIPVVVSERRVDGARLLCEHFGVDTILLDDGFQHRALNRQLDILLLDCALIRSGGDRLLPAGRLREGYGGLSRAHCIVCNHWQSHEELQQLRRRLAAHFDGIWLFVAAVEYTLLEAATLKPAGGEPTLAFTGLADNSRFFDIVRGRYQGLNTCLGFPDHEPYHHRRLEQLSRQVADRGAIPVTTWKDAVKLDPAVQSELKLLVLEQQWKLGVLDEA